MTTTDKHEYRPLVPEWLRATVYALGVAVGVATILVMSTAYEWLEPVSANRAIVTMGGLSSATSFLASTLGIAYRPPAVQARLEHVERLNAPPPHMPVDDDDRPPRHAA